MIDERHEELASLYAFDLLEGAELAQFESALVRDPELQALVRELRNTSAALAHGAALAPPAVLKSRVLASVQSTRSATAPDNVVRPPRSTWVLAPWTIAACLALTAGWLGLRQFATHSELTTVRTQKEMLSLAAEDARQQLEAQRILTRRQVQDAEQQLAAVNTQLGDARSQLGERDRLLAEARNQLVDRDRQLADGSRQIGEARTQLANRDQQIRTLTQRIESLAGASTEIGRQLGEAKLQVAKLTDELQSQSSLAELKITALASMLKGSPTAQAIAVWDPKKQQGVLDVQNLPALAANQDYQLWLVDPQYPNPVDGGVFTVETAGGKARVDFKTKQPIQAVNAFAVTRERKGGVPKAEGPFVLLGK